MAEERDLTVARAPEAEGDTEATKAELQRRMEEARESITQTVTEIKDTVATQYQTVRESINDAFDWREQVKRRPLALGIGGLSAGLLLGYGLASLLVGDSASERDYDADDDDDYDYDYTATGTSSGVTSGRSFAAEMNAATSAGYDRSSSTSAASYDTSYTTSNPSYNASSQQPQGPGLIDRFKETRAFDRLQSEMFTLGDRLVNELSHVAQTVVLPAAIGKVKEVIGVDLSSSKQGGTGSSPQQAGAARSGGATSYSNTPGSYTEANAKSVSDEPRGR